MASPGLASPALARGTCLLCGSSRAARTPASSLRRLRLPRIHVSSLPLRLLRILVSFPATCERLLRILFSSVGLVIEAPTLRSNHWDCATGTTLAARSLPVNPAARKETQAAARTANLDLAPLLLRTFRNPSSCNSRSRVAFGSCHTWDIRILPAADTSVRASCTRSACNRWASGTCRAKASAAATEALSIPKIATNPRRRLPHPKDTCLAFSPRSWFFCADDICNQDAPSCARRANASLRR